MHAERRLLRHQIVKIFSEAYARTLVHVNAVTADTCLGKILMKLVFKQTRHASNAGISNSNFSVGQMKTCKVSRGPHYDADEIIAVPELTKTAFTSCFLRKVSWIIGKSFLTVSTFISRLMWYLPTHVKTLHNTIRKGGLRLYGAPGWINEIIFHLRVVFGYVTWIFWLYFLSHA